MAKKKTQLRIRDYFESEEGKSFLTDDASETGSNQLSDNNSRTFKLKKKIHYVGGK